MKQGNGFEIDYENMVPAGQAWSGTVQAIIPSLPARIRMLGEHTDSFGRKFVMMMKEDFDALMKFNNYYPNHP